MTTDLSDRYGTPGAGVRMVLILLSVLLAAVFLGWLGWVTWFHATPDVRSELTGWVDVDDHTVHVTLDVDLEPGVTASCTVRAFAEDHSTVGELVFTPVDGSNEVEVRTERRATAVESVGCTAPGQPRPR